MEGRRRRPRPSAVDPPATGRPATAAAQWVDPRIFDGNDGPKSPTEASSPDSASPLYGRRRDGGGARPTTAPAAPAYDPLASLMSSGPATPPRGGGDDGPSPPSYRDLQSQLQGFAARDQRLAGMLGTPGGESDRLRKELADAKAELERTTSAKAEAVQAAGEWPVALLKKRDEERLRLEAAAAEQSATLGRRLDSFRAEAEAEKVAERARAVEAMQATEQAAAAAAGTKLAEQRRALTAVQAEQAAVAVAEREAAVAEAAAAARGSVAAAERRATAVVEVERAERARLVAELEEAKTETARAVAAARRQGEATGRAVAGRAGDREAAEAAEQLAAAVADARRAGEAAGQAAATRSVGREAAEADEQLAAAVVEARAEGEAAGRAAAGRAAELGNIIAAERLSAVMAEARQEGDARVAAERVAGVAKKRAEAAEAAVGRLRAEAGPMQTRLVAADQRVAAAERVVVEAERAAAAGLNQGRADGLLAVPLEMQVAELQAALEAARSQPAAADEEEVERLRAEASRLESALQVERRWRQQLEAEAVAGGGGSGGSEGGGGGSAAAEARANRAEAELAAVVALVASLLRRHAALLTGYEGMLLAAERWRGALAVLEQPAGEHRDGAAVLMAELAASAAKLTHVPAKPAGVGDGGGSGAAQHQPGGGPASGWGVLSAGRSMLRWATGSKPAAREKTGPGGGAGGGEEEEEEEEEEGRVVPPRAGVVDENDPLAVVKAMMMTGKDTAAGGKVKSAGQDESKEEGLEEINAQDVVDYATMVLGLDLQRDAHLLWLAEEALLSDSLPKGWEERVDAAGRTFWKDKSGKRDKAGAKLTTYEHPTDLYYKALAKVYLKQDARQAKRRPGGEEPGGGAVTTRRGQLAVLVSFYGGTDGMPVRSQEHCESLLDRRAALPGEPLDKASWAELCTRLHQKYGEEPMGLFKANHAGYLGGKVR